VRWTEKDKIFCQICFKGYKLINNDCVKRSPDDDSPDNNPLPEKVDFGEIYYENDGFGNYTLVHIGIGGKPARRVKNKKGDECPPGEYYMLPNG
jgi:hypothetical protein